MTLQVVEKVTKEREYRVLISKPDLAQIIADAAYRHLGLTPGGKFTAAVTVENNTEGSPAYNSGHKAVVIVKERLE